MKLNEMNRSGVIDQVSEFTKGDFEYKPNRGHTGYRIINGRYKLYDEEVWSLVDRQSEVKHLYAHGIISFTEDHVELTNEHFTDLFGEHFEVEERNDDSGYVNLVAYVSGIKFLTLSLKEVK